YELLQEARVTLTFKKIDSLNPDGSHNLGVETVLIRDQVRAEGEHRLLITPADLPAGDYEFELKAVATVDGQEEIVRG
ncbi:MAG: hypothetical protein GWO04_21115, partial [Actinobacteria bacterium]|nr:hypothetical protein [Actinomycetota bacterium]